MAKRQSMIQALPGKKMKSTKKIDEAEVASQVTDEEDERELEKCKKIREKEQSHPLKQAFAKNYYNPRSSLAHNDNFMKLKNKTTRNVMDRTMKKNPLKATISPKVTLGRSAIKPMKFSAELTSLEV